MSPVHVLGQMEPTGKTWRCQRQTGGVKCRHDNPSRLRKCQQCGKPRPPRKRPDHMKALDMDYAGFIAINGGTEQCGICGLLPKPGKRHARDHDHKTGLGRGLLCFQCNRMLGNKQARWLRLAAYYLERHEDRVRLEEAA